MDGILWIIVRDGVKKDDKPGFPTVPAGERSALIENW